MTQRPVARRSLEYARIRGGIAFVLTMHALVATAAVAQDRSRTAVLDSMVSAVQNGGTILLCRHAITGSFNEREPVSCADLSTQRHLSAEGERQSRPMGEAFRTLGIVFSGVVASPMDRARRTTELIASSPVLIDSIWYANDGNYGGSFLDRRRAVLSAPVLTGNVLIVSHTGTMSSVAPRARRQVGEGDCVVIRPSGSGFDFVGVMPWRAWLRAAGHRP